MAVAYETEERKSSTVDNVACLSIGYGHVLGDVFYLGLESLCEIGSRKSKSIVSDSYKGEITRSARSVQLGARFGYVAQDIEAMFYLKGGIAFTGKNKCKLEKTKFPRYGEKEETPLTIEGEMRSSVPFIGVGVEKHVFEGLSLRLEAETTGKRSYAKIPNSSSRSKTVRLILVWNFNSK
ncbi:MAG: hypothetical protein LBE95_02610 [Holosporaceae bacterium]|nr:hypothetical protein [Holosporaceae bacterium]